jgi:hypothetical protein
VETDKKILVMDQFNKIPNYCNLHKKHFEKNYILFQNQLKKNRTMSKRIDTTWREMKNWSWGQIDGFEGEDRFISTTPIIVITQEYSGKIHTKVLQKPNIKLTDFTKVLDTWFKNQNGDQNLIEIKQMGQQKQNTQATIVWVFFDS